MMVTLTTLKINSRVFEQSLFFDNNTIFAHLLVLPAPSWLEFPGGIDQRAGHVGEAAAATDGAERKDLF